MPALFPKPVQKVTSGQEPRLRIRLPGVHILALPLADCTIVTPVSHFLHLQMEYDASTCLVRCGKGRVNMCEVLIITAWYLVSVQ